MAFLFDPLYQAVDANGLPLAGATLSFYRAGTTTKIAVFQDSQATTPHTNPVVADASGLLPPIFLTTAANYKTVLKNADGITVQTVDRIPVGGDIDTETLGQAVEDAQDAAAAAEAAATGLTVPTIAALQAANIAASVKSLRLFGYSTATDGGGHQRKRVASQPSHGGGVRSLDRFMPDGSTDATNGGWWDLSDGQIYSDRMFGVVADAVLDANYALVSGTDDTAALQVFAAFMKFKGGGHFVLDGGIRKVWPSVVAHGSMLLDISGVVGARIEYLDGAAIHAMHPNSTTELTDIYGIIWHVTGCDQLEFVNPRITQEGHTAPTFSAGIVHFDWGWSQSSSPPFTSIKITGVHQIGGIGGVIVRDVNGSTDDLDISTGLEFEGYFEEVYYPFNLQANGDRSKASLRTYKCARSLFVYNVNGLDADVVINTPTLTSGAVNLTCFDDPTMRQTLMDCRIHAKVRGSWTADPGAGLPDNQVLFPINLIHTAGGSGGLKVRNIQYDIDVIMAGAQPVAGGKVISVNKYDNSSGSSAADTTARGNQVQGVVWTGSVEGNFTGAVEPFSLFCDNPLGSENWTGDQISDCGFDHFYAQGSEMDLHIDGRGINASVGMFFIRDSFFGGSAHLFDNMAGKWQYQNSYLDGLTFTYTPAWTADTTDPALGNGTLSGEYEIDGDYCVARIALAIGSTTTFGTGNWKFSLPLTPKSAANNRFGGARVFDAGTTTYAGLALLSPGETVLRGFANLSANNFNASVPITWANGDNLSLEIRYRWK